MTIRMLEELTFNAWPARQTVFYDGWLLRLDGGYTRRANSINPTYVSTLPVAEKVAYCEAFYARHRLPTIFRLTSDPAMMPVDDALANLGYVVDAPTLVKVCDSLETLPSVPERDCHVVMSDEVTNRWLTDYTILNKRDPKTQALHKGILKRITGQTGYLALLNSDNQIFAQGLGVIEHGWVGIYDVIVSENYRRQGWGRYIMLYLLNWAKRHGAQQSYLQVMENNSAALALYDDLGYQTVYNYWYRVLG